MKDDREVRELVAYLDRIEPKIDKLNHFELLEIPGEAHDTAIQRAFHQAAARLHPDRHRVRLAPSDLERLVVVYGRIAEAYRVLRDPTSRLAYRQALAASDQAGSAAATVSSPADAPADGAPSSSAMGPKAQRLYRRAQAALRTGDTSSALLNLKLALASEPQSSFLREALDDLQKGGR